MSRGLPEEESLGCLLEECITGMIPKCVVCDRTQGEALQAGDGQHWPVSQGVGEERGRSREGALLASAFLYLDAWGWSLVPWPPAHQLPQSWGGICFVLSKGQPPSGIWSTDTLWLGASWEMSCPDPNSGSRERGAISVVPSPSPSPTPWEEKAIHTAQVRAQICCHPW